MTTSAGGRRTGARANQRALQEAITQLILQRGLAPGAPLPTEFELMQELEVSRHPLREAMKALEAQGIVDIRHGYGTYVGSAVLSGLEAGLAFRGALSVQGDHQDRYAPSQDWAFHETLYRPLANALVLDLLQVFWRVFHTLDEQLPRAGDTPGRGRRALPGHPRPHERTPRELAPC